MDQFIEIAALLSSPAFAGERYDAARLAFSELIAAQERFNTLINDLNGVPNGIQVS